MKRALADHAGSSGARGCTGVQVDTRTRILDTALASFLELGYGQTAITWIRERSGVSNGALFHHFPAGFHHFPAREAFADALHVDAIRVVSRPALAALEQRPRSLRAAVRGVIAAQLERAEANVGRARFVYQRGDLAWDSQAGAQLGAMNRRLAAAYRDWIEPFARRGLVRLMSMLLLTAVEAAGDRSS